MYNIERTPNFNTKPSIRMDMVEDHCGYDEIVKELKRKINSTNEAKIVVVIDCFHGVNQEKLHDRLCVHLGPELLINSEEARLSEADTFERFKKFIVPDDRTYGMVAVGTVDEFFDQEKIKDLRKKVQEAKGLVVVYGVASSVITCGDILIYGSIPTFFVRAKYNSGLDNWGAKNFDEETLKKDKRGMFVEWPLLNKHKLSIIKKLDYYIDFSNEKIPNMVSIESAIDMVKFASSRPFQFVPLFMKAIWGGQWLKKVFGVHNDWENCGWGLTGFFNLQYVDFKIKDHDFLFDGQDMLHFEPKRILGESIFYTWGYRCPVSTNYLDTWEGGNLSLQVHPPFWYGQQYLNATHGHHESYYMMDTTTRSSVYLGLKTGTKVLEMVEDLNKAQETASVFDDSKYVNKIPMNKHQHVYIPSGTVHASSEGTCVLEIDQYTLATFKLYDWGRVDYDGKPRPINIDHGKYCIQEDFQTDFVHDRLISKQPEIGRGDGWRKEDSSAMNFEPMTIYRYWLSKNLHLECNDAIQILVVVEGEEIVIESVNRSFEPFVAHYGEATFIPAAIGQYTINTYGKSEGSEVAVVVVTYPN